MPNTFHQRCKLALTHPVTLGAVGLLLVNDWLLKPVWQSDWTTGKISDFAWVVFFPPLLALLFSLVARGNTRAQRGAFLAAYAGLPVLYAAYNTFTPLHDWIMGGFMHLSGASAGSPLDPWDSLVIPPAMAVALWVWRGTAHSREGLRARLHLYALVIAALATVATSPDEKEDDFGTLGLSNEGAVVFQLDYYNTYLSLDGGYSWEEIENSRLANINWGRHNVKTPRGTYSLDGERINLLTVGGELRQVHSTAIYLHSSDKWMLRHFTGSNADALVFAPSPSLVYDPHSGNTIVSMSTQGVLVGNADEEWKLVPVGHYVPTDFSFGAKARQLFSLHYWLVGVAIALSIVSGVFSWFARRDAAPLAPPLDDQALTPKWASWSNLAIVLLIIVTFLVRGIDEGLGRDLSFAMFFVFLVLIVALIFAHNWGQPITSPSRQATTLFLAFLGFTLSIVALPVFSQGEQFVPFALGGIAVALSALGLRWPARRQLPAVIAAFVAMNLLLPLPFLLWLADGVTLWVATLGAGALLTLVAVALYKRLMRQAEAEQARTDIPLPPTPGA